MRLHRIAPLLCSTLALAGPRVQAPDAPWRTLRTAHFRIHHPARGGFEPFAREVAEKVEDIHAKVAGWVGYASPEIIEVVVRDPLGEANGYAFPLLKQPFVVLWRTPPEPDSGIAHVTTWAELLVTHELTHIHHLVRPQRRPNLWDRLLGLPVGPLARKLPRWVGEGYATVIEGKVTGKGRPHSAYRAAVIRAWALEGKLPDYPAVSASEGFRGGSMAYLIGSAYLEWLEARTPQDPEVLRKLWKQLASPKRRDFEPSFKATFGFAAGDGYDRWRAEVTRDALELERRAQAEGWLREGELFTKVDGEVTDLAVSPDGRKLLARVLTKEFRGLRVWDLATQDPHAKGKGRPQPKPDPEEVADVPPRVPQRPPTWSLGRVDGAVPRRAAWDGGAVVLELRRPNGEGVLTPTFRRWVPGQRVVPAAAATIPPVPQVEAHDGIWTLLREGRPVVRTLSAAWNPAPSPDGRTLYFTRLSATGLEIRRIDLGADAERARPVDPLPLTRRTVLPPADEPSTLAPPVAATAAAPYAAAANLRHGTRFAATLGPSGQATQFGLGGADLLGRAGWQALAGFGDAAGPRGAALGFAWRGWRWAPSLEAFTALARPSRQEWTQPSGFDSERRGAELAFTFEDRGNLPFTLRPHLAFERVERLDGGDTASRRLLGLDLQARAGLRPGEAWSLEGRLALQAQRGRSEGSDWTLQRAGLQAVLGWAAGPALRLEGEAGRSTGPAGTLDRFHLGGAASSLLPAGLDAGRVAQPALPTFLQTGDRFRRIRAALGGTLRVYGEAAVLWNAGSPAPAAVRVLGCEAVLDDLLQGDLALPLLGRTTFAAGVHRILGGDPRLEGRTTATLSVVVRP